jgi:hypothetical protein
MIQLKPKAKWKQFNHPLGGVWFRWGDVSAHVAKENDLWHVSVSLPYRYPTWDEIYQAWYDLCPDAAEITGAILLPKKAEYVNIHANCFHVYQLETAEISAGILL